MFPTRRGAPCGRPDAVAMGMVEKGGHKGRPYGPRSRALPPPRERTIEPHHVADDLSHGLVVLGLDFLVDLDRGMDGARERRILDDRNAVLARHLADLPRDEVDTLGDTD